MYRFVNFTLDPDRSLLTVDGVPIPLARKAVDTLSALVENAGNVTSKAELMDRLWPEGFVEESNLTQYVYLLRRTFLAYGIRDAIATVPRRGYRFTLPLRIVTLPLRTAAELAPQRVRPTWWRAVAAGLLFALGCALLVPSAGGGRESLGSADRQAYLVGRYYWTLRTVPALFRSIEYFRRVARDAPANALAFSGLADAYVGLFDYGCNDRRSCARYAALAQRYARRGISIDPNSAATRTSLAMVLHVFARDDGRADEEFQRAVALDPGYALAHEWYGNSLLVRGRLEPALRELKIAAALDPIAPATYGWLARSEYYAHRYRAAIAYAHEALAIDPTRAETRLVLGLAYDRAGDRRNAIETLGAMTNAPALIAGVEAHFGHPERARALIARDANDDLDVALDLVALRRFDDALRRFKRVRHLDPMSRAFLALDPRLDSVRSDLRFKEWT